MYIDMSDAPKDPIERLIWLSGAKEAFEKQINPEWQRAYYEARRTGRIERALALGFHARKKILAWTRAENEASGRLIKWGDGYSR